MIHQQLLICFLQMSVDEAFNTTIEILNASTETLTLEKVLRTLENKEPELADTTIRGEAVQFAGRGRGDGYKGHKGHKGNRGFKAQENSDDRRKEYLKKSGGCWSYGGDHFKHDCGVWRQTKAGKAWLASIERKAELAQEGIRKSHAVKTLKDSDSESEESIYLPSSTRVKSTPQR